MSPIAPIALAAAAAALAAANLARDIATNGVNLSISVTGGHSESHKVETHSLDSSAASTIAAGRNLGMVATGGGKDSNINVVGSELSAKNSVRIRADNQVNLTSAQDLEEQHSSSRSMSAAAGIGITVGTKGNAFGVAASVSASRAQEDGSGVTQRNTHVSGGDSVSIVSGGDANLRGAVIAGNKVSADIGGNLNIESRQDTAKFDSKSQSVGVSGMAGWGASVSASYSQGKIGNDYASVQEQSGIRAGDGGFDVRVRGNTDLRGGVISSTQDAIDKQRNTLVTRTLTQSDLQNHADYRGESFGVSGGISSGGGDGRDPNASGKGKGPGGMDLANVASTSGAGMGMPVAAVTSGSASSVTKSGISAGSIVITDEAGQQLATGKSATQTIAATNRDVATGRDTSGRLANDFDKEAVQANLAIISAFTRQASPLAANMVGDYSKAQQDKAQQEANGYLQQADSARRAGDLTGAAAYDDKARQAQVTADNWSENGVYRLALHAGAQAAVGGAGNGVGGAAAAAGGTVGGFVGQQLGKGLGEQEADRRGLTGRERAEFVNSYQQGMATVGGVVGGAAVGGGALAAVQGGGVAYSVDRFNRQLHQDPDPRKDEKRRIRADVAPVYGAAHPGMSVDQATEILAAQLLRQVDSTAGAAGGWNQEAANALNAYKSAHPGETVGKDQWGNPVPLFGTAAGYQRNDSTIFSENSQTATPPVKLGTGSMVDYAKGVGQGIIDKVAHPIDTLKDAAVGVYDMITDPKGTAQQAQAQARNVVEQAGDGNFKPAGEQVGQQIGTTAVVTGAGAAAGVVAGKVVKVLPEKAEMPTSLPKNLDGFANPKDIRFSQDSVANTFKDGTTLQSTVNDLKSGKLSPNDLPSIRVFEKDGVVYTLDNRRLLAASEAGVPVKIVPASADEIAKEGWKFTTQNGGTIICVRGICK